MENPIAMIEAHQKRVDKMNGEFEIGPNGLSIDLLRAVYRNTALDLSVRMRAAQIAINFECPKLAVVAQITEQDFAVLLDRRLENMRRLEQAPANGKAIEAVPSPAVEVKPQMPRVADRRFRRI
jgi:hypothetical protein